jgi:hypothetical protein
LEIVAQLMPAALASGSARNLRAKSDREPLFRDNDVAYPVRGHGQKGYVMPTWTEQTGGEDGIEADESIPITVWRQGGNVGAIQSVPGRQSGRAIDDHEQVSDRTSYGVRSPPLDFDALASRPVDQD